MKYKLGFTITEVIVVVAVLSVVLTLATPDLTKVFAKQSEMTEKIRLRKIYDALDLYAKEHKKLPSKYTWVEDIIEYTDLSEDQIKYDVWGREERKYDVFTHSENYLGGSYDVYYAYVISGGLNEVIEVNLPTNKAGFGQLDSKNSSGNEVDDLIIKYTDQAYKLKLLDTTLNRMEKLSLALEKYARVKQITAIDKYPNNSDEFIFFPKDSNSSDGLYFENGANMSNGDSVSISAEEGVELISDGVREATGLAKVLGLPAEYGQDALTDDTMWYISNPGNGGSDLCSGARDRAPYYPPIITVSSSDPC